MTDQTIPNGVNQESKTWPYVLAFAIEMEKKLEENAHKDWEYDNDEDNDGHRGSPGWLTGFHPHDCIRRIFEEARELHAANEKVYTLTANPTEREHREVTREAADVGNMVMMLACITGDLKPVDPLRARLAPADAGEG